jgi:hypothetical protein
VGAIAACMYRHGTARAHSSGLCAGWLSGECMLAHFAAPRGGCCAAPWGAPLHESEPALPAAWATHHHDQGWVRHPCIWRLTLQHASAWATADCGWQGAANAAAAAGAANAAAAAGAASVTWWSVPVHVSAGHPLCLCSRVYIPATAGVEPPASRAQLVLGGW